MQGAMRDKWQRRGDRSVLQRSQHRPHVGPVGLGPRDIGTSDSVDAGDHSAGVPPTSPEGTVILGWIHNGFYRLPLF